MLVVGSHRKIVHAHRNGNEEGLAWWLCEAAGGFEFLVQHAFMCGVLVNEDHALGVLCDDVAVV